MAAVDLLAAAATPSLDHSAPPTAAAASTRSAYRNFYGSYINDTKYEHDDTAASTTLGSKETLLNSIRSSIIGGNEGIDGPFGIRPLVYADYTASGRSLSFIEDYIRNEVLPLYANTHTLTSTTGIQTTMFRREARDIILRNVHASKDDVAFFAGTGATGAIMLLLHLLGLGRSTSERKTTERAVVFVGPYEHHSNLLPWREANCDIVVVNENHDGGLDIKDLEAKLIQFGSRKLKIGTFSAASNVSGILTDTLPVTALLHRYGALSFWDYAAAAPYIDIDMNPKMSTGEQTLFAKDGIMFSPHKMVGGPGTPGVLVIKKQLLLNFVPCSPGGGTVLFVRRDAHRYLDNFEEREEGGTPDIVGSIRAGLVFQLKEAVGVATIKAKETLYTSQALASWSSHPNIVIMGNPTAPRLPIISFLIRVKSSTLFLHHGFVSVLLNDVFGIQSRSGCMCAGPYGQGVLGIDEQTAITFEESLLDKNEIIRPGFTRVNFNYFIHQNECDYIIAAVNWIADHGWKLLPSYGFFVDSGEWKHRSRITKFVGRRWLGSISYKSGSMVYRSEHRDAPRAPLSQFITAADTILERALASYTTAPDAPDFLPTSASSLRWFMSSSEALRLLRGVVSDSLKRVIPIAPKFDFPMMEVPPQSPAPPRPKTPPVTNTDTVTPPSKVVVTSSTLPSTAAAAVMESKHIQPSDSTDDYMDALPSGMLDDGDTTATTTEAAEPSSIKSNGVNWEAREKSLAEREASIAATAARRQQRKSNTSRVSNTAATAASGGSSKKPKRQSKQRTVDTTTTTAISGVNDKHDSKEDKCGSGNDTATATAACDISCTNGVCRPAAAVREKTTREQATPMSARKLQRRGAEAALRGPTVVAGGDDICVNCYHRHGSTDGAGTKECLSCPCITFVAKSFTSPKEVDKLLRNLCQQTAAASKLYNMIQEGDRILVGVSGGKDSLTLVHILLALQKRAPVRFEIGCATVDPQTPEYDPSVLKGYFKSLGIPYFYESQAIMESAKNCMDEKKMSICSFCSRMKRGILYACCRREKYNVLALGQHLDDLAESFVMSAFHNGFLRTMKANYHVEAGDIRIIRPLCLIRERLTRQYAKAAELPVINENCPACFEAPKERQRAKLMLAAQENIHPQLFSNLLRAMQPLMKKENKAYKTKLRVTPAAASSTTTSTAATTTASSTSPAVVESSI